MSSRKILTGVTTVLTTLCLAAGAQAGHVSQSALPTSGESTSVSVRVDDLNLSTPAGQEVLMRRLANAAEAVCGSSDLREAGSVVNARRNAACQNEALSRAMARVNQAAVASIR